jgi:general secretion pathway protein E
MHDLAPVELLPQLDRSFLLHHAVCPSGVDHEGFLVVECSAGVPGDVLDEMARAYNMRVRRRNSTKVEVERLIERATTSSARGIELERTLDSDTTADVGDLVHQAPVIRYVNLLVREAWDAGASDVHLEATRAELIARYRIDGVLTPAAPPPPELQHAVVSRLKLLADLDIAERRRPQDGRIRVRLDGAELDLRVATIPTMYGESVVLRLLDRGDGPSALSELGLPDALRIAFEQVLARPHGLLLVTGPTGSGKTSTLYAGLRLRDASREKIITVEDPIEYQLSGITQVPVQRVGGVTFASALRAILRQDPDVLMVGEMRDAETAEVAIQAAMTGHLVLSTLHTNDAASAVPRLRDLGIPSFLIAQTLDGVLAQRLVRRVCAKCATTVDADRATVAALAGHSVARARLREGKGCVECRGTGFRGRVGIFEMLRVSDAIRQAIAADEPLARIRELASAAGDTTLRADAWDKVRTGVTTLAEVQRAIYV